MKQENKEFLSNLGQALFVGLYVVLITFTVKAANSQTAWTPIFYLLEAIFVTVAVFLPLSFKELFDTEIKQIGGTVVIVVAFTLYSMFSNSVGVSGSLIALAANSLIVAGGMALSMSLFRDSFAVLCTKDAETNTTGETQSD